MATSEQINEIALALAKAQGAFETLEKAKTAKVRGTTAAGKAYEYEYKYADIADVLASVRKALSENGLSVVQFTKVDTGTIWLNTRLIHASGQWVENEYPVCDMKGSDHQKMGGALTYARRYALCALIGIAAEDDLDGDAAAKVTTDARSRQQDRPKPQEQRPPDGQQPLPPRVQNGNQQTESKANSRATYTALEKDMRANKTADDLRAWWSDPECKELRHTMPKDWQETLYQAFVDYGQDLAAREHPINGG